MELKGIFLASFFVISAAGCTQVQATHMKDSSNQQSKQQTQEKCVKSIQGDFSDSFSICEKIKQLHEANGLQSITITNSNFNEDQYVDLNNDKTPDKIRYMPTRTYMALVEIRNGRKIGFPTEYPTAFYTGADIVHINGINYVLHYSEYRPYELTEVGNSSLQNTDHPYQLKTLCKFYE